MNSQFAQYILKILNPTVHVQVGDLARLPIPKSSSPALERLVNEAIEQAKLDSREDDTTYDFIAPPAWATGLADSAARNLRLAEVERQIDEEVYRLYGIGPEDRAAIEAELAAPVAAAEGEDGEAADAAAAEDEATAEEVPTGRDALAQRWLSYAAGVALGRFRPGEAEALGCGGFPAEAATALRALADDDGIMPLAEGHTDDLAARVEQILALALGADGPAEIAAALGLESRDLRAGLRAYLAGPFCKAHVQRYRKRPVYWLLQSPKRHYGVYLFHERLTRDSLFLLQGPRYLGGARNGAGLLVEELRARAERAQGAEKRRLQREQADAHERLRDLDALARALAAVTEARNDRGEVVGWAPELDDGVLLNLAPLHALLPSPLAAEARKAWARLEAGDYDWSHTAMRYWPTRVLAKCRTNKSYAIAHGREDACQ